MKQVEQNKKREQREKQKTLSGHCPNNVLQEIDTDKELDIEIDEDTENDGLKDRLDFINASLNKTTLIQEETDDTTLFLSKRIHFLRMYAIKYIKSNKVISDSSKKIM